MGTYSTDRAWTDRFIPQIKQIVGPHLLVSSPDEIDRKEAADLIVLTARALTVACRVRRHGYATKYPNQFTIRSHRDSGAKTELCKITDGWGDLMFYGHANEREDAIAEWMLIDLRAFRAHLIQRSQSHPIRGGQMPNGDGTYFAWFDAKSFVGPPTLLVAQSQDRFRAVA